LIGYGDVGKSVAVEKRNDDFEKRNGSREPQHYRPVWLYRDPS
jgi:hypothetical protein